MVGLISLALTIPLFVSARVGVGVGAGKIQMTEQLKPGKTYELPVLPILNTGDEFSAYEATVEYHENIPQMWPKREWFKFTPQTFELEPGQVKNVKVELSLPVNAKPGEYRAYLEGHPVKKSRATGGAAVGVAAAADLRFTVVPANILAAWYYKITTFYSRYHPYDTIGLALLASAYLFYWVKKNFKFQIAKK